jgi:decaprenylphospho-beta-D-erythro-pentofuranosid-2-ulose 2-reductase
MAGVLILGASSDLARALAYQFAPSGMALMLAGRHMQEMEATAADIRIRFDIPATCHHFDAGNFSSHRGFYDNLPQSPSIVISAVGYLGDTEKGMHDFSEAEKIILSNYTGLVSILNIAANELTRVGGGTIIGISSVAGERGRQSNFLYGSAKAGFTAYLSGLRNKLYSSGVHVMTVKPGFMRTAMTRNMELSPALTASPEQAAQIIYQGFQKKRNTLYVLWFWRYIMMIIKAVPERIFKKLKM